MNNFEKIKNMSVDEMAEWLNTVDCSNYCEHFINYDRIYENLDGCGGDCFNGIKQWLQAESEG